MTSRPGNQKITDEGVAGLGLVEGRAELLEEIMAIPTDHRTKDDPTPLTPRRRTWTKWAPALAAAAAVAAVATTPLWLFGEDEKQIVEQPPYAAPGAGEIAVLTAEGWKLTYSSVDAEYGGELSYESEDQSIDATPDNDWGVSLDIMWRPAEQYDTYVEDRQHIDHPKTDPGTPLEVLGKPALLWAYSADDHTVIREVVGDFTLEVRGSGMDEKAFRDLLGQLEAIAPADLDAHLPDSFVTDAERADVIAEMLEPIPVPQGFDRAIESSEVTRYHLGADVTGTVTCAWIAQFETAKKAGDRAAMTEAQDALATARDWPILKEMKAEGDWSPVIWEMADEVAEDGTVPSGYEQGIGCD